MKRPLALLALILTAAVMFLSCTQQERSKETSVMFHDDEDEDTTASHVYDLPAIRDNGEIVAGMISGPDTYYELRDETYGTMFLLVQDFARGQGIRLRVELATDTTELLDKLANKDIDILAMEVPSKDKRFTSCGSYSTDSLRGNTRQSWLVRSECVLLAESLSSWYLPSMKKAKRLGATDVAKEGYKRREERPMIEDGSKNIISPYDALFRKYAPTSGFDWTLLAAMAWQESGFDPQAESYAGAKGIMQLMPRTAEHYGVKGDDIWDPETNIRVACEVIKAHQGYYKKVDRPIDRIKFILAAYNCGAGHVGDAMELARQNDLSPLSWDAVETYLAKLNQPEYYTLPCVKHGYVDSRQTTTYVHSIMARWAQYSDNQQPFDLNTTPTPAKEHLRGGKYHNNNLYTPVEMR